MTDQERIQALEQLVIEQIPNVQKTNRSIAANEPLMPRTKYINWLDKARALGLME